MIHTLYNKLIKVAVALKQRFFVSDAVKKVRIGAFQIFINGTHALPRYLKNNPDYSSNLPRLAKHLTLKYPDLILIDIGANIGDTIALVKTYCDIPIVSIEGNEKYYSILEKNKTLFKNVETFKYLLDEKNHSTKTTLESKDGTAFVKSDTNSETKFITLDSFISDYPSFEKAKLVKIDTDGYDLKIIRGGLDFIQKTHPVLFFEFDRYFLTQVHDDGISTLQQLADLGYSAIVFYDNSGRLLVSLSLNNIQAIKQLYQYTYKKRGAFPYYDVCIFHKDDEDIALSFIEQEIKRQNENTL
jgi:FkbM family methyltransferase